MKLFVKDEIMGMANPAPEKPFSKITIADGNCGCKDSACALLIVPPQGSVPLHHHETREIWLFMIDGEIEQTVGEHVHSLKTGDMLFIAPGEVHGVKNISNKEARFVEAWTRPEVEPDFYPYTK